MTSGTRRDLIPLDSGTYQVLEAIRGQGGTPWLAGDCVRDALMTGSPGEAIGIEVHGMTGGDAAGRLSAALARVFGPGSVNEAGKSSGLLKVNAGGTDLDITLPRRERATGESHQGFAVAADPALSLKEATACRDFTVNAALWNPGTGELADPWGGLDDMRSGILRHVTGAFTEDPVRVLRGAQLASRFGFYLAPETAALCRSLAGAYAGLPKDRIWREWAKMTGGEDLAAGLRVLADSGWERHYPQLARLHGVEQDPRWHPEGDVHVHSGLAGNAAARIAAGAGLEGDARAVVVLAALCHDLGKPPVTRRVPDGTGGTKVTSYGHAELGVAPAGEFLAGIGAPASVTERVLPVVREHMCHVGADPTPAAVRRLSRRLGPATVQEWAMVCHADHAGRGDPDVPDPVARWAETARSLGARKEPPSGILNGQHLIGAGLEPGPAFGLLLEEALRAQADGVFSDEAGAVRWLEERLGSGPGRYS